MRLTINADEHGGILLNKYNNLSDIEELVLTGDFYNISNSFNNCPKLKKVSIKTFNSLEEIVGDTCGIEQLIHK